ncbi:DotU family type IV/VI secretion system protein [Desulfovibrio sp. UCD-KL4C]|uniref:DotU family type IV/VI secretion system protein n=1 Tax=Desulfovibrio sp. UCD-KL4C TaxID=2578120 RepID=UPI0025C296BD|nr:DotU family type IV/VI secretion system protein [Desulfovibrio sp. UCD-KL4C]
MITARSISSTAGSERLENSVIRQFREFNELLFKVLNVALSKQSDHKSPEQLQDELIQLLQSQIKMLPPNSSTEGQLVMVGLADDLFLSNEWYGQAWWNSNPLEYRLFGTRSAGDRLYVIADRIIFERSQDNVALAAILLDAFALGFTGKYGDSVNSIPTIYRTGLRELIVLGRTQEELSQTTFCPDAYGRNFTPAVARSLPSIRYWVIGAGLVCAGLLVLSHLVWFSAIDQLRDVLNQLPV